MRVMNAKTSAINLFQHEVSQPFPEGNAVLSISPKGSLIAIDSYPFGGYWEEDLTHLNFTRLVHPDESSYIKEILRRVAEENTAAKNIHHRFLLKDGSWRRLITSFIPSVTANNQKLIVAVTTPATKPPTYTKHPEADGSLYHQFFYNHPLPMCIVEAETLQFLDVNESAVKSYGYSREEFLAMNLTALAPIEDAENFINEGRKLTCYKATDKHRKKNGEIVDVEIVGYKLIHKGKLAWMSTVNDITERKKAEEEIVASELRYKMFIQNSSEAILRFELKNPVSIHLPEAEQKTLVYENAYLAECNDALAQRYGYNKADEIIGLKAKDIFYKDPEAGSHAFKEFIRSNYKLTNFITHELDRNDNVKLL